MKTKGGSGIIIEPIDGVVTDQKAVIDIILSHPNTQIKYKHTDSTGGFLFDVTFNRDIHGINLQICDTTQIDDAATVFRKPTKMLLKVILMDDAPGGHFLEITPRGGTYRRVSIISKVETKREVETQQAIFNGSFDQYFEAICPNIFYAINCRSVPDVGNTAERIFNKSAIILQIAREFGVSVDCMRDRRGIVDNPGRDLAFIFMEFPDNGRDDTPIRMISDMFKPWGDPMKGQTPMPPVNTDAKRQLIEAYIYEVIRLWGIGYIHGDLHLDNALYVTRRGLQYISGNPYRVYLIDFGRTEQRGVNNSIDAFRASATVNTYWSYQFMYDQIQRVTDRMYDRLKSARRMVKGIFSAWVVQNVGVFRRYREVTYSSFNLNNNTYDLGIYDAIKGLAEGRNIFIDAQPYHNVRVLPFVIPFNNGHYYYGMNDATRRNLEEIERHRILQSRHINGGYPVLNIQIQYAELVILKWILVVDYYGFPNMYFSRVSSRFEAGTKHIDIIRNTKPRHIIAAGELKIDNVNNIGYYNLNAGTFIQKVYIDRPRPDDYACIQRVTLVCFKLFLGSNTRFTEETFIDERLFSEVTERNYLINFASSGAINEYTTNLAVANRKLNESRGGRVKHSNTTNNTLHTELMPQKALLDIGKQQPRRITKKEIQALLDIGKQQPRRITNKEIHDLLDGFEPQSIDDYKRAIENSNKVQYELDTEITPILVAMPKDELNFLEFYSDDKIGNEKKAEIHESICGFMGKVFEKQLPEFERKPEFKPHRKTHRKTKSSGSKSTRSKSTRSKSPK